MYPGVPVSCDLALSCIFNLNTFSFVKSSPYLYIFLACLENPNELALIVIMKRFEDLFRELEDKVNQQDPASETVKAVHAGPHEIGKKILEEAGEVWMAANHETPERTAEEISQLIYHAQVMMLACNLSLDDIYRHL